LDGKDYIMQSNMLRIK